MKLLFSHYGRYSRNELTAEQKVAIAELRAQALDDLRGETASLLLSELERVRDLSLASLSDLRSEKFGRSSKFFSENEQSPLFEKSRVLSRRIQSKNRWGRSETKFTDPYNIYTIYARDGSVASTVKTQFTTIGSERLEYVGAIKTFYAPKRKRPKNKSFKEKVRALKRRLSKERAEARKFKRGHHKAVKHFADLGVESGSADMILLAARNGDLSLTRTRAKRARMFVSGTEFTPTRCGRLRQERVYILPSIPSEESGYQELRALTESGSRRPVGEFELANRLHKSRINNRDGSYSVLLTNGRAQYTVTNYGANSQQLQQTTFSQKHEAVRANSDFRPSRTVPKQRRRKPTDRAAKLKAQEHLARRELGEAADELDLSQERFIAVFKGFGR